MNSQLGSQALWSTLYSFQQLKPHVWALSLKCMYQHVSECTKSLLSKADRNHLVASRTSFFHKCCHCSGACLGIHIQHREIIARPVIICLSAAEWQELLTFYFEDLVWMFSSKEASENRSDSVVSFVLQGQILSFTLHLSFQEGGWAQLSQQSLRAYIPFRG